MGLLLAFTAWDMLMCFILGLACGIIPSLLVEAFPTFYHDARYLFLVLYKRRFDSHVCPHCHASNIVPEENDSIHPVQVVELTAEPENTYEWDKVEMQVRTFTSIPYAHEFSCYVCLEKMRVKIKGRTPKKLPEPGPWFPVDFCITCHARGYLLDAHSKSTCFRCDGRGWCKQFDREKRE